MVTAGYQEAEVTQERLNHTDPHRHHSTVRWVDCLGATTMKVAIYMAQMSSRRLHGDLQTNCYLRHREARIDEPQDLHVSPRQEGRNCAQSDSLVLAGRDLHRRRGVMWNGDIATRSLFQYRHDLPRGGFLCEVSRRLGPEGVSENRSIRVHGEDHHRDLGELIPDPARRVETVKMRRTDVNQYDVRPMQFSEAYRLVTVSSLGDDASAASSNDWRRIKRREVWRSARRTRVMSRGKRNVGVSPAVAKT